MKRQLKYCIGYFKHWKNAKDKDEWYDDLDSKCAELSGNIFICCYTCRKCEYNIECLKKETYKECVEEGDVASLKEFVLEVL